MIHLKIITERIMSPECYKKYKEYFSGRVDTNFEELERTGKTVYKSCLLGEQVETTYLLERGCLWIIK